jgi:hypothetical protein
MRIHRIIDIDFHRNGISGAPFHVIVFDDHGEEASRKVGIVFDSPYHVAVLDVAKLAEGIITFGQNSWRGDVFELELRAAINDRNRYIEALYDGTSKEGGEPPKTMFRRRLEAVLDEVMDSDDPSFTTEQVDLLEKRFFEIRQDIDFTPESESTVPVTELLETLRDCVHILADYDEQDGDEGDAYRRCLALLEQLSQQPFLITAPFNHHQGD